MPEDAAPPGSAATHHAPPALLLLEGMLNAALAGAPGATVRVERVVAGTDRLTLHVRVRELNDLVDGVYPVLLRVETTTPEATVCRLALTANRTLGRLLAVGLSGLPGRLLNRALAQRLHGAVEIAGDRLTLHHRPLARRLLHRSGAAQGGL